MEVWFAGKIIELKGDVSIASDYKRTWGLNQKQDEQWDLLAALIYPLVMTNIAMGFRWPIEIDDFLIKTSINR